jgi:F-type H+-transporting ATPase subunit delta
VLGSSSSLRHAVSEQSRSSADKQQLLPGLFGEQISEDTHSVISGMVASRWSSPLDLVAAVEQMGVTALAGAAQRAQRLDEVEDELFRFTRILAGNHDLQRALSNPDAPAESKTQLIDSLVGGKIAPEAQLLITAAAVHPRGRTTAGVLDSYGEILASRRARQIATVTSAVPIGAEQQDRLAAALSRVYDRELVLNVQVDPQVIGGMKVQVGDEVLDGSIATRLDDVRRRLAS